MKALIFSAPGEPLSLKEVQIPTIEPDQLLVRVKSAGICGTDLHFYRHDDLSKSKKLRYPYILGHEMAGEVVEVGKDVTGFSVGDRITTETHVPCGKCFYCKNHQQHICEHLESFAQKIGGVFAEYCRVPEYVARKLPANVGYKIGSMFEPLGVAVRAANEVGCQGDTLLVTGCGPIGLMAIGAAKVLGAGTVIATDIVPERLKMAEDMGADYVLDANSADIKDTILKATEGLGPGGYIDASGSPQAFVMGLEVLRKGGKVVVFGLGVKPAEIRMAPLIVQKETTIVGILGRKMFSTWKIMESLLGNEKINLEPVIGKTFPLEQYKEAFELAISGKTGRIFFEP